MNSSELERLNDLEKRIEVLEETVGINKEPDLQKQGLIDKACMLATDIQSKHYYLHYMFGAKLIEHNVAEVKLSTDCVYANLLIGKLYQFEQKYKIKITAHISENSKSLKFNKIVRLIVKEDIK